MTGKDEFELVTLSFNDKEKPVWASFINQEEPVWASHSQFLWQEKTSLAYSQQVSLTRKKQFEQVRASFNNQFELVTASINHLLLSCTTTSKNQFEESDHTLVVYLVE